MERNFRNREFEQYLKSTADQYRMIPTDKVWKGINNTLHTRRKWYGIGLAFLLLSTAVSVTWIMLTNPSSKKQQPIVQQTPAQPAQSPIAEKAPRPTLPVSKDIGTILTFNKVSSNKEIPGVVEAPVMSITESGLNSETEPVRSFTAETKSAEPSNETSIARHKPSNEPSIDVFVNTADPLNKYLPGEKATEHHPMFTESRLAKSTSVHSPLTIESVVNSYQAKKIVRKLSWQLYFAPTVSYRKLSVNKSYDANVSPFSATNYPFTNSSDVNSQVTHKPDMGLELGLSTKYPLSKKVKLTGAFQFNINRYDIKAFAYYGEEATINLNGGNGTNSVKAWTYYRNFDGYKSDWLKNYYFSVSAPIGAELRLIGSDKTYFGVAGTLQPTYIIKDRAFLISTDYKNYVEIPRLISHWNINTSLETFISYTSKSTRTRWQVGPQVRYQVLSSFKKKYPVKENLFDFGLKVGISRNK